MPSSCLGMQRRAGLWPPVHGAYPYMGADGSNGQTPGLRHLVTDWFAVAVHMGTSCLVDRLGASQETVEPAGVVKTGSSPETHSVDAASPAVPVFTRRGLCPPLLLECVATREFYQGSSSKSRPCRHPHLEVDTVEVTGAAGRTSEAQLGQAPLSSCV